MAHIQFFEAHARRRIRWVSGLLKGETTTARSWVSVSDGNGGMVQYRPLDLSITKNVAALIISALVVALMAFWLVRWYKRNGMKAPRRGLGAFEVTVAYIYDGVIKPTLGVKAKEICPIFAHGVLFHPYDEPVGADCDIPRRCQPDGQPCRYIGIVDFHFLVDQLVWYQALLERHILARCALVAQGALYP